VLLVGDDERSTRIWTSPRSLCLADPDVLPAVSPLGVEGRLSLLSSLGPPKGIGEERTAAIFGWKGGEEDIVLSSLEARSRGRSCP
jgi:hypothetical protein